MNLLFFDTETTGKANFKAAPDSQWQPRIVSLAAILVTKEQQTVAKFKVIVKPEGFTIPEEVVAIHGISTEMAEKHGVPCDRALSLFHHLAQTADTLIAYNSDFDSLVITGELMRRNLPIVFDGKDVHCAMKACTNICKIPNTSGYGSEFKWPKLQEAHEFFFKTKFDGAHDALADVEATVKVHFATQKWLAENKPAATAA